MKTLDDVDYLIPNAEFITGKIINWTRSNPHATFRWVSRTARIRCA